MKFTDRLSHAWNAFKAKEHNNDLAYAPPTAGVSSSYRQDRTPLRIGTERSIIASIYNRIAIDVAAVEIRHARVDQNGRFQEEIHSNLNECLSLSANKDQTARAFFMDVVLSMFDEGVMSIVPVDTTLDITKTNSYDIQSMRVGKITQWMPDHVRIELYNDRTGLREEIVLEKSKVCIVENPLYQVMNEPNSTLQRLRQQLALLDATDEKQNSNKLNMIIQLPYSIKSQARMEQAEDRRKKLELQLAESKYGIAYIDSTEKITQIGRPIENRLIEQIEYFTNQLYAQLGLTPEVFNGTADERVMLNYNNRTIEPIVGAIADEMQRKFLTKTARTQGQAIVYFRNPFSLVTMDTLADMADKFTRNEILSGNEFRAQLGFKPVDSERADDLLNKNINPAMPSDMGADSGEPEDTEAMSETGETTEMGNDEFFGSLDQNGEELVNTDIESMSQEELEAYLKQLESFNDELDELNTQVDDA